MPPSASSESSHYIPTLDGWRAIAILWVMVVHSQPWRIGTLSTTRLDIVNGVDLFFALSGFLICTRLLREESATGTISLQSFYLRRIFRIQPAALTYLAVLSLLGLTGLIALRWSGILTATLMVRNIYPRFSRLYPEWYTGHFWSLAVEEHFYLLFPAFLLFVRRNRLTVLTVIVVALEIWHWIVFNHPALQGGALVPDFRTDMAIRFILTGSLAAIALEHPRLRLAAVRWLRPWIALLMAAAIFTAVTLHHSRINHALFVPLYPLLIVATSLHPTATFSRLLDTAPLRYVGRISFSLYLWQQLFFFPYASDVPNLFRAHALLRWPCAFAAALLSYYLVERPLIRLGHRLASRQARGYPPTKVA